jgi:hypothetical protein
MSCTTTASAFDSRSEYVILRAGGGVELEVPLFQGDFSAPAHTANQRDINVYTAQGTPHTVKEGAYIEIQGSFTAHFNGYTHTDQKRLYAFVTKERPYEANQPVCHPDLGGDAYLVDIVHGLRGKVGSPPEEMIYRSCHLSVDYASGDPSTLTVNFRCIGGRSPVNTPSA